MSNHCDGFQTAEELEGLEKGMIEEEPEKIATYVPDSALAENVESESEKSPQEVVELENTDDMKSALIDSTKLLLTFSHKERVEEALWVLLHDRTDDFRGISQSVDEYLNQCQPPLLLENQVDDSFLDEVKSKLKGEDVADFELCISYLSRSIKNKYALLTELFKDDKLGESVREIANEILEERRLHVELSEKQIRTCIRLFVEELEQKDEVNEEADDKDYDTTGLYVQEISDLKKYQKLFRTLTRAQRDGIKAPHKPILLLALIALLKKGDITSNHIELSTRLEAEYEDLWKKVVPQSSPFTSHIGMPFWHMQNEPFWHVIKKQGPFLDNKSAMYSVKSLQERVYVRLDDRLYELLQIAKCRNILSDILLDML